MRISRVFIDEDGVLHPAVIWLFIVFLVVATYVVWHLPVKHKQPSLSVTLVNSNPEGSCKVGEMVYNVHTSVIYECTPVWLPTDRAGVDLKK